jgi:hypothetical protein
MKSTMNNLNVIVFIFLLTSVSLFAQDNGVENKEITIEFESAEAEAKAKKDGFDSVLVATKVAQSKQYLGDNFGKEQVKNMIPIAVTYKIVDTD